MESKVKSAYEKYVSARKELANAQIAVINAEEKLKHAEARAYVFLKEDAQARGQKMTEAELKERVVLQTKEERSELSAARSDKARAERDFDIARYRLKSLIALMEYMAGKGA